MADDRTDRSKPPILLLHGVSGCPELLRPWIDRREAQGYVVHAPALPGRNPTDDHVLARTGIEGCFALELAAHAHISTPAIVIGHCSCPIATSHPGSRVASRRTTAPNMGCIRTCRT